MEKPYTSVEKHIVLSMNSEHFIKGCYFVNIEVSAHPQALEKTVEQNACMSCLHVFRLGQYETRYRDQLKPVTRYLVQHVIILLYNTNTC